MKPTPDEVEAEVEKLRKPGTKTGFKGIICSSSRHRRSPEPKKSASVSGHIFSATS